MSNDNHGDLITVKFQSFDLKISYSINCKSTDNFSKLEHLLYEEYPKYRETENYFLCNGIKINKNKTVEENKIRNNDTIVLAQLED